MNRQKSFDEILAGFQNVDTPLMDLMLTAKVVETDSPEVDHTVTQLSAATTVTVLADSGDNAIGSATIKLSKSDLALVPVYSLLLVKGIYGYDSTGQNPVPGEELVLFVERIEGNIGVVAIAINGRKLTPSDEYGIVPLIPAGTELVILSALGTVAPEMEDSEDSPESVTAMTKRIFLGRRSLSDKAVGALEEMSSGEMSGYTIAAVNEISGFKVNGNLELLENFGSKVPMRPHPFYTMSGVREQLVRTFKMSDGITRESVVSMVRMFFNDEQSPKEGLVLAGSGFIEGLMSIGAESVPGFSVESCVDSNGRPMLRIFTVFGTLNVKRDCSLDRAGHGAAGLILVPSQLVHYVYDDGHSHWDALALDGTRHMWIESSQTDDEETNTPPLS